MDKILQGIAASKHPENVKRALFLKFAAAAIKPVNPTICHSILTISADLIREGETEFIQEMGKAVFQEWAKQNLTTFEEFFHHSYLVNVISGAILNPKPTVEFIHHCVKLLHDKTAVCKVIQTRAISLARECPHLDVCAALCRLMVEFPECIPLGDFTVVFCVTLIQAVSAVEFPNSEEALKIRFIDVNAVGALLHKMWHAHINTILPSLQEIFKILTTVTLPREKTAEPSVALGCIAQHVPVEMITLVTKNAASDPSVVDMNMTVALTRMIDWLSWPAVKNIDRWIIAFLRSLASVQKFTILINVTVATVEKVFSRLCYPIARNSALAVLTHMLLSFQHSPEAFHKVVNHTPDLVRLLLKEDSLSSQECLSKLAELIYVLIHQHAGYPDLYEPIIEILKNYPRPSEEVIKQKLKLNAWTSHGSALFSYNPKFTPKSETGKTGLTNLGNTCYVNSVIQALFMADGFRREILNHCSKVQLSVIPRLQSLFAFLAHTQRPSYSPSDFLQVSRPPWFAPGAQQDCSEFLKYLLDRVSDEDTESIKFEEKLSRAKERLQRAKQGRLEVCDDQVVPQLAGTTDRRDSDAVVPCIGDGDTATNNQAMAGSGDHAQNKISSLVEHYFGGNSVTVTRCFKCDSVSTRKETFTDLPLAFPEKPKPNGTENNCMKGGHDNAVVQAEDKEKQTDTETPMEGVVSADGAKGGKSAEMTLTTDKTDTNGQKETAKLDDLIDHFLAPEVLEGENQYYCEKCESLQDAERFLEINYAPQFLILTLLRFSYDVKHHTRSKLLTDVKYPKILRLPLKGKHRRKGHSLSQLTVHDNDNDSATTQSPSIKRRCHSSECSEDFSEYDDRDFKHYALTSVIVHSGTSSESGHYYCYARHTTPVSPSREDDDPDYLPQPWYLFNDSRVSYSSYNSFSNVTKLFCKDTAYVLFYKRISEQPSDYYGLEAESVDPPLERELLNAVTRDNQLYLQEQELEARTLHLRSAQVSSSANYRPRQFDDDDDDNQGPPGSCGGSGTGGFNVPSNRFIF